MVNSSLGGIIEIYGNSNLISGTGSISSTLYANNQSQITLAGLDITNNSKSDDTAGILSVIGSTINVDGNATIRMNSGAAISAKDSSKINLKDITITINGNSNGITAGIMSGKKSSVIFDAAEISIIGTTKNYGLYAENVDFSITANKKIEIKINADQSIGIYRFG